MQKEQVKIEYSTESVQGISVFTTKQIESLTFAAGIVRLREDLVYVIPRQWIHNEKLTRAFRGHEFSKKVFLLGVDPESGSVATVSTLSINSLQSSYYGDVEEWPNLKISAIFRNGVYRAPQGTSMHSVFDNGGVTFLDKDNHAYVAHEMAFKVGKRHSVWVTELNNTGTPENPIWDMSTISDGDSKYLKLVQTTMNRFTEVTVPDYEFTRESVGQKVYDDITKYQEDLPE